MSFGAPAKLTLVSLAGVGGTVGIVYVGGKAVDFSDVQAEDDSLIETVADKYKNRLIKSRSSDKKWGARLKKLRSSEEKSFDSELQKIKDDEKKTATDLKNGCDAATIKPGEKDSLVVKGVEAFCTLMIKDQARNLITDKGGEKGKLANGKLKDFDTSKLSKDMKKLQEEVKQKEDSDSLEKWCFERYEESFIDTKEAKYVDVSAFCVKVSEKSAPKGKPDEAVVGGEVEAKQAGDI